MPAWWAGCLGCWLAELPNSHEVSQLDTCGPGHHRWALQGLLDVSPATQQEGSRFDSWTASTAIQQCSLSGIRDRLTEQLT